MAERRPSEDWRWRARDQATIAAVLAAALAFGLWTEGEGETVVQGGAIVEHTGLAVVRFEVDVNQARWPELTLLPGIGPKIAQRVVECRESVGAFQSLEELRRVSGIGATTLAKLQSQVAIAGTADYVTPIADEGNRYNDGLGSIGRGKVAGR